MKMDFQLNARGAARGRKRASTSSEIQRGEAELRWVWMGVTSCQETKNFETGEKSISLLHKKSGLSSHPFTVSSLFAGSDTCHIWDSAGADEQGAGWSVTSRRQRTRCNARWLINHRTNQNGATELGWCHIMIRDRSFVKTRGNSHTLLSSENHVTAVLVIFLFYYYYL